MECLNIAQVYCVVADVNLPKCMNLYEYVSENLEEIRHGQQERTRRSVSNAPTSAIVSTIFSRDRNISPDSYAKGYPNVGFKDNVKSLRTLTVKLSF